ncbi:hypothetical protein [Lentilactobacillus kribbianus]|uniref:hypothetical protein n=1 Tax=Lentilactobacillus kribbianus TaxID=2729622 RepID=UPI0015552136|nr:hypothetical protein [Lentilactobacillus kribbianus]
MDILTISSWITWITVTLILVVGVIMIRVAALAKKLMSLSNQVDQAQTELLTEMVAKQLNKNQ